MSLVFLMLVLLLAPSQLLMRTLLSAILMSTNSHVVEHTFVSADDAADDEEVRVSFACKFTSDSNLLLQATTQVSRPEQRVLSDRLLFVQNDEAVVEEEDDDDEEDAENAAAGLAPGRFYVPPLTALCRGWR